MSSLQRWIESTNDEINRQINGIDDVQEELGCEREEARREFHRREAMRPRQHDATRAELRHG